MNREGTQQPLHKGRNQWCLTQSQQELETFEEATDPKTHAGARVLSYCLLNTMALASLP